MNRFLLFFFLIFQTIANGQIAWQQTVNYSMNIQLEEEEKSLTANNTISYINNSPFILDTIFFHLWANAHGDKQSEYSKQAVEFGNLEVYFDNANEGCGYKNLTINLEGQSLDINYYKGHSDIAFVLLPKPLESGGTLEFDLSYTLDLPKKFSRLGYEKEAIHLAHWYPRIAVYDNDKWHPLPYLGAGEFYGNYGTFECKLESPSEFTVLSPFLKKSESIGGRKMHEIEANNVHDIAIFLHRSFKIDRRDIQINENTVELQVLRDPENPLWDNALNILEETLLYFSKHVGDYPYSSAGIVQNDLIELGNMEYPAVATISAKTPQSLEYYIAHEVGHFWFQGIIGFNERDHAWMDEGLTTYYEHRFTKEKHGEAYYDRILSPILKKTFDSPFIETAVVNQVLRHTDQAIASPVHECARANYGINNYERSAMLFRYLAEYCGEEIFDGSMQDFYKAHKYQHPGPAELKASLEAGCKKDLDFLFKDYIREGKSIDYSLSSISNGRVRIQQKGIASPFILRKVYQDGSHEDEWMLPKKELTTIRLKKKVKEVIIDPDGIGLDFNRKNNYSKRRLPSVHFGLPVLGSKRQNDLNISPLLSGNTNDGLGLGLVAYNSTIPSKNWKYLIWPQYSLQSKRVTGQAWTSYTQYMDGKHWQKWVYRIGLKSFSMDNSEALDIYRRYIKVDPSIDLYFSKDKNSRNTTRLKASYIKLWEDISMFDLGEFTGFRQVGSHIVRLGFHHKEDGHLAPKQYDLVAEQGFYENIFSSGNRYLKLTGTAIQEYKYSPHFGVSIRLHGAIFIDNSQKDKSANINDKGVLSLLYQGFNDYAYDGYYLARYNQRSSFDNQVSTLHGGGFKQAFGSSRSTQIGQSQRYILSSNVVADLPIKIKNLKVQAYFDYGIYGQNLLGSTPVVERRNLYSGGISLDVYNGLVGLYLPIINSEEFSNIYKEEDKNILGRITFSLNLHKYDFWHLADNKKL